MILRIILNRFNLLNGSDLILGINREYSKLEKFHFRLMIIYTKYMNMGQYKSTKSNLLLIQRFLLYFLSSLLKTVRDLNWNPFAYEDKPLPLHITEHLVIWLSLWPAGIIQTSKKKILQNPDSHYKGLDFEV